MPQSAFKSLPKTSLAMVIITLSLIGLNAVAGMLMITASRESQITLSHLEALKTNRRNLEQLQADLLAGKEKIAYILEVLPTESDIPEFIQFVSDAADKQKVQASMNFTTNQPNQTKDGLAVTPLNINVTGPEDNIATFLDSIQGGKYQIRFKQIDALLNQPPAALQFAIQADLYVAQPFATGGKNK